MSVDVFPQDVTESQFRELYLGQLRRHSAALTNEIKQLLARTDISPDVTNVDVQVFPDEYGDGHVFVWMYFNGRNRFVRKNDPTLYCGAGYQFAKDVDGIPLYNPRGYEFSVADLTVDCVIEWFVESWKTAGGENFRLPAVIAGHDGFGNSDPIDLTHIHS